MKHLLFSAKPLPVLMMAIVCFLFSGFAFSQSLLDKKATPETKALYENLFRISGQGFLFGHQDTDAYGVKWKGEDNRSDVKDITGSFPAVHGWDLGDIGTTPFNLDSVPFDGMLKWIQATYNRGGINTISWHFDNPLTGESAWSKGEAVKESLPGGKAHQKFLSNLNALADFLNKCESESKKIPIIFRPYHEHNGDWFWWGKGVAAESDYIKLWKFTIDYLRNDRNIHHLIYAFSPDRSRLNLDNFRKDYFYAYPGDDYVDILGFDNYHDIGKRSNADAQAKENDFKKGLSELSKLAAERKKVAALTETGLESVADPKWYTQTILEPIKSDPSIKIAYLMVWRNARVNHHYAPYPGHPSADDFMIFYKDDKTLFESDIQNFYISKKNLVKK
jgi:mannan endo-1,4-beta-mannosidase